MTRPEDPVKPLPIAASIVPRWGHERRERLLESVHTRVDRARARRGLATLAIACITLIALIGVGVAWRMRTRSVGTVAIVSKQEVRFSDGSSVHLLGAEAALDIGTATPSSVEVTLRAGSAEFAITPNPHRRFIVHAGVADVSVLGTEFRVTRDPDRVRVEVTHGRVSVAYVGGARVLTDGESNWFPPAELAEPAPTASSSVASPGASSVASPGASSVASPGASSVASLGTSSGASLATTPVAGASLSGASPGASPLAGASPSGASKGAQDTPAERGRFLEHASRGEYAEAYAAIERTPDVVGNDAADLLRAADAARFSDHPLEATRYLERVVREHARESVAPLAAFTLGRIELSQLGQPAKAADAFGRAFALAPNGSLAEDALARETEAAELAGERDRARQLAAQYLERFPHGRRADSVRRSARPMDGNPPSHSR